MIEGQHMSDASGTESSLPSEVPVIDLSEAPGAQETWGRPAYVVYVWAVVERVLVTNSWQISSRVRVSVLRLFGAKIGEGVVFRPRTRVKSPWMLTIGDRSWIGEDVWIHNQDRVEIGSDVVISQGSFITTGSHAHRRDMALITKPIVVENGAWVTARCVVLGGTRVQQSALVAPQSVVSGLVKKNTLYMGNPATPIGNRFDLEKPARP